MECRDAMERLSADVDRELPAVEAESLRHHLQSCDGCARKRAVLESTRNVFRAAALEPISADFTDAVVRRLRPRIGIRWWLSAAVASAAVLALVLLRESEPQQRFAVSNRQPERSEGRGDLAADCGLLGATTCIIDTPCRNGECALLNPIVSVSNALPTQ